MDWQKPIHSDPNILLGKPVIKGTRLSIEFLLGPSLRAVFAFAAEAMREEAFFTLQPVEAAP